MFQITTPTTTTTGGAIAGTRDAGPTARRSASVAPSAAAGARGGMVRRGEIRPLILAVLATKPMHGYEVITELEAQSGGRWRPSAGSVYPTLQQLSDEGLVTSEEIDGRRVYALTDEGKAAAAAAPAPPGPMPAGGAATTSASWPARSPRPRCRSSGWARPKPRSRPRRSSSTRAPSCTACSPSDGGDRAATCRPTSGRRRAGRPGLTPPRASRVRENAAIRPSGAAGPRLARATSSRARNSRIASVARSTRSFGSGLSAARRPPGREDQREQHPAQQLRRGLGRQPRIGRPGLREATDDRLLELGPSPCGAAGGAHRRGARAHGGAAHRRPPAAARSPTIASRRSRSSSVPPSCAASSIASWIDAIRCQGDRRVQVGLVGEVVVQRRLRDARRPRDVGHRDVAEAAVPNSVVAAARIRSRPRRGRDLASRRPWASRSTRTMALRVANLGCLGVDTERGLAYTTYRPVSKLATRRLHPRLLTDR